MFTFEFYLVSIITSYVKNLVKSRVTYTATEILQEISDASYKLGTWFLKIDPERIVCMRACVSVPEAINN